MKELNRGDMAGIRGGFVVQVDGVEAGHFTDGLSVEQEVIEFVND